MEHCGGPAWGHPHRICEKNEASPLAGRGSDVAAKAGPLVQTSQRSGICDSIIRKTAPAFRTMLRRSDDRYARIKENEEQHEATHKSPEYNPHKGLPGRLTLVLEVFD